MCADRPGRPARNCILLTRPEAESRQLAQALQGLDAECIVFPTLEIRPIEPDARVLACVDSLERYALAIFVSVNAVRCGLSLVRSRRAWPAGTQVAAIGAATAQALSDAGFERVLAPGSGNDSEALLAHPALGLIRDARVLLVRGVGGREHLARTLRERGAQVDYLEAYRRVVPDADVRPLRLLINQGQVCATVAASAEGLDNLVQMLGRESARILGTRPVLVHHARIAAAAAALGFVDARVVPAEAHAMEPVLRACLEKR
ncbi:MAG: uroporphyrinogen-III synthase [Burkholderiales bacterium]|nr:uroporphyrinogen-III synthase [Burkholderiales bacterium]